MTNLRKAAKGKRCEMQLVGVCNDDPETTVLAHIRRGNPGVGRKPHDLCAVRACFECHREIDLQVRRVPLMDLHILAGLMRTWVAHVEEGLIEYDPVWEEIFHRENDLIEVCRLINVHKDRVQK